MVADLAADSVGGKVRQCVGEGPSRPVLHRASPYSIDIKCSAGQIRRRSSKLA